MAAGRFGFADLGLHELKGFTDKWRLFALDPATVSATVDEPASAGEGQAPVPAKVHQVQASSLPPALVRAARGRWIGALAELDRVARAGNGDSSGPSLVLIAGEPGVGKTRLAAAAAASAAAAGALVLFGRCDEG